MFDCWPKLAINIFTYCQCLFLTDVSLISCCGLHISVCRWHSHILKLENFLTL